MNPQRLTPRYIIIKTPKVKDKENLKSSKEKAISFLQGTFYKTISLFLNRNIVGQKGSARNIRNDEKQKPRLLYPAKLSFRIQGQIKSFPDKNKLKEFIITKPLLYES